MFVEVLHGSIKPADRHGGMTSRLYLVHSGSAMLRLSAFRGLAGRDQRERVEWRELSVSAFSVATFPSYKDSGGNRPEASRARF